MHNKVTYRAGEGQLIRGFLEQYAFVLFGTGNGNNEVTFCENLFLVMEQLEKCIIKILI